MSNNPNGLQSQVEKLQLNGDAEDRTSEGEDFEMEIDNPAESHLDELALKHAEEELNADIINSREDQGQGKASFTSDGGPASPAEGSRKTEEPSGCGPAAKVGQFKKKTRQSELGLQSKTSLDYCCRGEGISRGSRLKRPSGEPCAVFKGHCDLGFDDDTVKNCLDDVVVSSVGHYVNIVSWVNDFLSSKISKEMLHEEAMTSSTVRRLQSKDIAKGLVFLASKCPHLLCRLQDMASSLNNCLESKDWGVSAKELHEAATHAKNIRQIGMRMPPIHLLFLPYSCQGSWGLTQPVAAVKNLIWYNSTSDVCKSLLSMESQIYEAIVVLSNDAGCVRDSIPTNSSEGTRMIFAVLPYGIIDIGKVAEYATELETVVGKMKNIRTNLELFSLIPSTQHLSHYFALANQPIHPEKSSMEYYKREHYSKALVEEVLSKCGISWLGPTLLSIKDARLPTPRKDRGGIKKIFDNGRESNHQRSSRGTADILHKTIGGRV